MPGILPMKVIKVGAGSQSRIAQACDRCRSKKIRCDGIRPCCSQCATVGFECKTSDKLSRRAFPRGYTESLEERVRLLETEVRELKDLLDGKDEKIDMLVRMHSNRRSSVTAGSPASDCKSEPSPTHVKEDVFRIQASSQLVGPENADACFIGPSSARALVDVLKRKIQESGKSLAGFDMEALLNNASAETVPRSKEQSPNATSSPPPRVFSDRCVNIFFQEWAPLFPVLHKPTFLGLYGDYMSNPKEMTDHHTLAQMNLVFGIASLSTTSPDHAQIASCETQFRASLDLISMDNTLATLQCLVLAILFYISKADYSLLQHYKGIAVGLSQKLGLHQSQKRFSFGALTTEIRKRVFWTLYTVDCFSAALLGLPQLIKNDDIHAEYPSDTDDEYVTEKGFQPTLPGEYTKISSALALFRVSRVLSRVLGQNYPTATTHELSLQGLNTLDTELTEWWNNLPKHLKLTFVQDKPSTDITGSRSSILSLAFYYIRYLIHRPAAGSSLGDRASPSILSLADSSKHIIQIVQLLDERALSFSFCLNRNEVLTLCGLCLLYQALDLKSEGKMMQDSQRLVTTVAKFLDTSDAPGAYDFSKLASSLMKVERQQKSATARNSENTQPTLARYIKPNESSPTMLTSRKHSQQHLYKHASSSISEADLLSEQDKLRRAAIRRRDQSASNGQAPTDTAAKAHVSKREARTSAPQLPTPALPYANTNAPNLDYLPLSSTHMSLQLPPSPQSDSHESLFPQSSYPTVRTPNLSSNEWHSLLSSLDNGQSNLWDAIYGAGPHLDLGEEVRAGHLADEWTLETMGLKSHSQLDLVNDLNARAHVAQSVLSFSEESLSSEDLSTSELGIGNRVDYQNALLPGLATQGNDFLFDGFEGMFGP